MKRSCSTLKRLFFMHGVATISLFRVSPSARVVRPCGALASDA